MVDSVADMVIQRFFFKSFVKIINHAAVSFADIFTGLPKLYQLKSSVAGWI